MTRLRWVVETTRARLVQMEAFDGGKSVHSARRVAQRDVVHRASGATTPMGRFAATLERTMLLTFRDEWAGRFSVRILGTFYNTGDHPVFEMQHPIIGWIAKQGSRINL
ncbi:MAG: hypothetical protein GY789_24870 [Hyphomicrobiales bacterium]|nr:hypothetical protein [Hyphomicrobiales bacterium]MCP5000884.1 hypothetical protein [Hyphomicrobiales bacterium]